MKAPTWNDFCSAVDELQWMAADLEGESESARVQAEYLYSREMKASRWHDGIDRSFETLKGNIHQLKITISLVESAITRLESIKPFILEAHHE